MIMVFILALLLLAAVVAWRIEPLNSVAPKYIATAAMFMATLLFVAQLISYALTDDFAVIFQLNWIPELNIRFQLALDTLSALLIILTLLLGFVAIFISWQEITQRQGFYYFNLLCAVAGIIGVFTASDLFLFFVFWEVMLLPITALIAIWGHESKYFAAIKFFIFTQVSSLCMLIAIIVMAYLHLQQHGVFSFAYQDLLTLTLPAQTAFYTMLGFFIAFAVKLPTVPLHSWLPDAHTQAPTAGSVLLAGILLKTGAYGLIRFVILMFPNASLQFAPVAMFLGVVSILYGAKMAFAQQDCKRLIAYSSVSHMGFVMMALFAFNVNGFNGAIVTMVAHGLSSAALFCAAGMIYSRIHSRQLADMGNIGVTAPKMAGLTLVFVAAAFGMPGLANFIGEFYSLLGVFAVYPVHAIVATLGLIGSAVYGMRFFQSAFHGAQSAEVTVQVDDLSYRELVIFILLAAALLLFGLYPQLLLQFNYRGVM